MNQVGFQRPKIANDIPAVRAGFKSQTIANSLGVDTSIVQRTVPLFLRCGKEEVI